MIEGNLFMHGGLKLDIALQYTIDEINSMAKEQWNTKILYGDKYPEFVELHPVLGNDGPLWNRDMAKPPSKIHCDEVNAIMKHYGVTNYLNFFFLYFIFLFSVFCVITQTTFK